MLWKSPVRHLEANPSKRNPSTPSPKSVSYSGERFPIPERAGMNFILFCGAWLGHMALLVFVLNRWYALPLPRLMLSGFRALVALLILAFPIWLWMAIGFNTNLAWQS